MNKKITFALLSFLLLLGITEFSAFGILRLAESIRQIAYLPIHAKDLGTENRVMLEKLLHRENKYLLLDSILGWDIAPSIQIKNVASNSIGARSSREYTAKKDSTKVRVLCFGDSFTHCDQVNNHETWQYYMEKGSNNLEVVNFGVPGFGLDQAFLKFQKKQPLLEADYVFIGFMPENIHRIMNVFRPFYNPGTNLPLTKPRFILDNNQLKLIPNPLPSLDHYQALLENNPNILEKISQYDYHFQYRYKSGPFDFLSTVRVAKVFGQALNFNHYISPTGSYREDSEGFKTLTLLFTKFVNEVKQNKLKPVVVLLPAQFDFFQFQNSKPSRYEKLLDFFKQNNIEYIDLISIFSKDSPDISLYFKGHYTPYTNQLVAKTLAHSIEPFSRELGK